MLAPNGPELALATRLIVGCSDNIPWIVQRSGPGLLFFNERQRMAKRKSDADAEETSPGFEQSLEDLEAIVRRLEHGGGSLDEALDDYAHAIGLLKSCHQRLEEAQRKVELLSGVDADGNPITVTVEETEISLTQKQELRSERRTAVSSKPRGTASENRPPRRPDAGQEGLF